MPLLFVPKNSGLTPAGRAGALNLERVVRENGDGNEPVPIPLVPTSLGLTPAGGAGSVSRMELEAQIV